MGYNSIFSIKDTTEGAITEPVMLANMKNFLKVDADYTVDDSLITSLMIAARKRLEKYTGCSFVQKTFLATLNVSTEMEIPGGPAINITSVNSIDPGTGELNLLEAWQDYTIYGDDYPRIGVSNENQLAQGWVSDSPNGLQQQGDQQLVIAYSAGWGASGNTLPEDLQLAIMQQVAFDFENRGDQPAVSGSTMGRSPIVGDGICYASKVTAGNYMRMNFI